MAVKVKNFMRSSKFNNSLWSDDKRSLLAMTIILLFSKGANAAAGEDFLFNSKMISGEISKASLNLFNSGVQLPGDYYVGILLNGKFVDERSIHFKLDVDDSIDVNKITRKLTPCISVSLLAKYGIDVSRYPELGRADAECANISAIKNTIINFDFYKQTLSLHFPDESLLPVIDGIAPTQQWDNGIPAFLLDYRANINKTNHHHENIPNTSSSYIQLEPGFNIGGWRLRNMLNWSDSGDDKRWQRVYSYISHSIEPIKSKITIGDSNTNNTLFDSVPFNGVMLSSDELMVPSRLREFSPVVRGIANTPSARVEVRQDGYLLYSTIVPQGAFKLTNVYPAGEFGELQVTVNESDGSQHSFTVPYSKPISSLNQGYVKYSLMTGKIRSSHSMSKRTPINMGTIMYGLPWDLTLSGGVQLAQNYKSTSIGLSKMLGGFGAISINLNSSSGLNKENGKAWRVNYNKELSSGAVISYSGETYNSSYHTLADTLSNYPECNNSIKDSYVLMDPYQRRWTQSLSIDQPLGSSGGFLSLRGVKNEYWSYSGHTKSLGISYSSPELWNKITFHADFYGNTDRWQRINNQQYSLWMSMPLRSGISSSYELSNSSSHGGANQALSLNGSALENKNLLWRIRESYRNNGDGNPLSHDMFISYKGGYGELSGNYGYSHNRHQYGAGVSGGAIISKDGLFLGRQFNESSPVALVKAPDITGASIIGYESGVKTDYRGYAIANNLIPYQQNNIDIDPVTFPDNVTVSNTSEMVVPTEGAVVLANFKSRIGKSVLFTLYRKNGTPMPFGSVVYIKNGRSSDGISGVVGNDGEVYLSGVPDSGELDIQWGESKEQSCSVSYNISPTDKTHGIWHVHVTCLE